MCVCVCVWGGGACTFFLSFFFGGGGGGDIVNEVAVRFFSCVHV